MAIIAIPSGLFVHKITWGQRDYSLTFSNADTGAQQTRVLAPSRWTAVLTLNQSVGQSQMALWKAMIAQLRGKTNQLAVYDFKNPAPAGTARGAMVLSGALAIGGTVLSISGATALGTLNVGDWIGVGGGSAQQLFMVVQAAAADGSGNISVTVEPPSRYAQAINTAVTWNQPTCLMRREASDANWTGEAATEGSVTLNMIESWE